MGCSPWAFLILPQPWEVYYQRACPHCYCKPFYILLQDISLSETISVSTWQPVPLTLWVLLSLSSLLSIGTVILEQVSPLFICSPPKLLGRFHHSQSQANHSSFGLAGLARRWLVYPAALIWPSSLSSTVLFRALHEPQSRSPANGWTITRYRFFIYLTIGAFSWFWFPDYIWTSLSTFAFITWIVPHNQKVNTIFGVGILRAIRRALG